MGISTALQTGVAGLSADSHRVGRISENIANANTVGYKRRFADLATTQAGGTAGGGTAGVRAVDGIEVSKGGTPITTGTASHMSVAGDGFFVVSKRPNDPVVANYMLTRAGSFTPDADGNLVNTAGYYLSGFPYGADGTIGTVDPNSFGDLSTVNVSAFEMQAEPTTAMSVVGNLPEQETGPGATGTPFVSSKTIYNSLGGSENVQLSWQPSTLNPNEWTLTVSDGQGNDYGTVDIAFADSGPNAGTPSYPNPATSLATAPATFAFDQTTGQVTLELNNGATPQRVTLDIGTPNTLEGITQFNGDFTPQKFQADGSGVSALERAEIDESGDVIGVFGNGTRRSLFRVPLAVLANADGMTSVDGNAFRVNRDSGDFTLNNAGVGGAGTIRSGSLEGSNVDIATELTDLIKVQRSYSSNAKVITTADEMLAETTNLKR